MFCCHDGYDPSFMGGCDDDWDVNFLPPPLPSLSLRKAWKIIKSRFCCTKVDHQRLLEPWSLDIGQKHHKGPVIGALIVVQTKGFLDSHPPHVIQAGCLDPICECLAGLEERVHGDLTWTWTRIHLKGNGFSASWNPHPCILLPSNGLLGYLVLPSFLHLQT